MTEQTMTVGELKKVLEPLNDNLKVELSVNYDNCDHIQRLRSVYTPSEDIDWIILIGKRSCWND